MLWKFAVCWPVPNEIAKCQYLCRRRASSLDILKSELMPNRSFKILDIYHSKPELNPAMDSIFWWHGSMYTCMNMWACDSQLASSINQWFVMCKPPNDQSSFFCGINGVKERWICNIGPFNTFMQSTGYWFIFCVLNELWLVNVTSYQPKNDLFRNDVKVNNGRVGRKGRERHNGDHGW